MCKFFFWGGFGGRGGVFVQMGDLFRMLCGLQCVRYVWGACVRMDTNIICLTTFDPASIFSVTTNNIHVVTVDDSSVSMTSDGGNTMVTKQIPGQRLSVYRICI